jgi:uncharacterized protein YndB with AHSA1/START domain
MEKIKTLKKSIDIEACPEKVWRVLFDNRFTPIWYAAFCRGSHPETDWMLGSKAVITDHSQIGLIGRIVEKVVPEVLIIEYEGIINNGHEDYESEHAQEVQGAQDTYRLEVSGNATTLSVESDIAADYCETMSKSWDRALEKVKEIASRI